MKTLLLAIALIFAGFTNLIADDKQEDTSLLIPSSSTDGLLSAIEYNDDDRITKIMEDGINMNLRFNNGETPIHVAAKKDRNRIVKLLVDKGVNPNLLNKDGLTPLYIATREGYLDVIKTLTEKNANVNFQEPTSGNTSLHIATVKGFEEIVKHLIEKHADVNITDKNGHSPLYIALQKGQKKFAVLLIENESNVNFELGKWKAVIFRCIIDSVKSYKRRNDLNAKMIANHVYTDVSWETALMESIRKDDAHSTNLIIKNCVKDQSILTQSLQVAALKGHADIVKMLIKGGANASFAEPNGTFPLFVAVENGHDNVVDALLEGNIDINMKDQSGKTALHVAIKTGSKRMVLCLIRNSIDVNVRDGQGNSPFKLALNKGNDEITLALIARGADFYHLYENWGTAYFGCVTRNASLSVINELTRRHIQFNQNWRDQLHRAIENDDKRGKEILMKNCNESMEKVNGPHQTVFPVEQGQLLGSSPSHAVGSSSSANENTNFTRLVIGSDINARDSDGRTQLHKAAMNGQADRVSFLILNGANINAIDNDQGTPLYVATIYSQVNVARLLIEREANVNAKNRDGRTALHKAASNGQADLARLLIERGADIDAKDNDGCTPLYVACEYGRLNVVELLIEKGANINEKNVNGWTPLHRSVVLVNPDVARHLIVKGASISLRNNNGQTPRDLAESQGRTAIAYILDATVAIRQRPPYSIGR